MAKIYRKRGNKLNEVVTFDSACTRQENQPLVYDATDGSVHTTTHIGCLDADDVSVNNLTVTGQAIIQEQVTDTIDSNTLVLRSNADAGLTGTENSGVIIHNYNGSEDLYAVTDNTGTFRVGTAASTTTTYAYLRYNKTDNKWYSTAPGVTPAVEVTPVGSPTSWDSVVTSGDNAEYTNIVFSVIDRTSLEPLTTRDESTNMEADYLTKWNSTDEKIITTGTSCTHDLCANGDITSTGDITADGNVCVKTNITVDGNSCVKGDSTVSGEIHSCKCITAPTACVSDDLYVAGDINNCNEDSIFHGSYGCFEKNVCIKGDLAIDGTIAVSSLTSDHVISVENTTNSPFYLPFVQNNHLVAGSNDLYTNGDLQYNPNTDVLRTKTFCSDRGIVQSAISGVTAADLGLTAGTEYSLSTIVSCLQACCGNKAVSYSFKSENATTPKVTEYGNIYAYHLTFEKLDNNDLSCTYTKARWLVTGENGVSWTVTGNTRATAGSATWTVNEHVVDQVCVNVARNNQNYPLILSDYQSTPSCSKKTLYTDNANYLTYNPSKNTLNARCINASASLSQGNLSYKYKFQKNHNSDRTTLLVLEDISCAVCCSDCAIGIIGRVCDSRSYYECEKPSIVEDVNFYIKVNDEATGSSAMDIKYYGYGENQLRPVIITRNDNKVYAAMCISGSMRFLSFDTIGACSVIDEVCVDANGVYKDYRGCTYAITKAGELATLCVNASSSNVCTTDINSNYPIVFSTCQAKPAAGCKTLYNDSANNLMYNPSTNTLTTCCICGATKLTINNPTGCTSSVTGQSGSILQSGVFELYSGTPAVDFHVNNAGADYSHRIIALDNCLRVLATNATGSTFASNSACYDFCSDGTFCAPKICGSFYSDCVTLKYTPLSTSPVWFKIGCIRPTSSLSTQKLDLFVGGSGIIDTISLDLVDAVANKPIWKISHPYGYDGTSRFTCLCLTGETSSWICPVTLWAQVTPYKANEYFDVSVYNRNITSAWHPELQKVSSPTGPSIFSNALCVDSTEISGCYKADCIYACKFIDSNPVGCTASVTGNAGSILQGGVFDLYSATPAIDFHHNNASADYSHRIIALNGGLRITATDATGSSAVTKASNFDFKCDGSAVFVNTLCIGTSTGSTIYNYANGTSLYLGTNSVAIGKASWQGYDCCNVAIGYCACACCRDSVAIGRCVSSSYNNAVTIGAVSSASWSGVAIGAIDCAGNCGIAIGYSTNACGENSIAIGTNTNACETYSIAIGYTAKANATDAIVIGDNACTSVNGDAAVVIGQEACGLGAEAIAIGDIACARENAVAIGMNAYAVENSTAIGYSARTGGHGFLALGKCANSYICQNVSDIYFRFPYSTTIEIDDPLYGRHGHIKFVIPSCSQDRDITNFLNCLFIREINMGRCKCTWSASSCCNVPTLVAHLSGFYWDDGGSSNRYQRWAPGINGRGNINELILLNTSSGAGSNLSVYDLIVTCGKNICTTSWNWGCGTSVWTCGMVGTIEF